MYHIDFDEPLCLLPFPMRPVIRLPGSHHKGIKSLRDHYPGVFPDHFRNYIDPFVHDGSMLFNVSVHKKYANDASPDLIAFYEMVTDRNPDFIRYLGGMEDMWKYLGNLANGRALECYNASDDDRLAAIVEDRRHTIQETAFSTVGICDLVPTIKSVVVARANRFRREERERDQLGDDERLIHLESAFKCGLYEHVRNTFNAQDRITVLRTACFYFLRRYCRHGVYRRNQRGDFTSAFGGVAVNPISPTADIDHWYATDVHEQLKSTDFSNVEFLDFLVASNPSRDDFVFLSPPGNSRTPAYTERPFGAAEHSMLLDWVFCTPAKVMLVLPPSPRLDHLYRRKKFHMNYFTKGFESRTAFPKEDTAAILIKNY